MTYRGPVFLPLLLIGGGVVLTLANLGYLGIDAGQLVARFWPLVLVAAGLDVILAAGLARRRGDAAAESRTLTYELGEARRAIVGMTFGAGDLTIARAGPGRLLEGTFEGGVQARPGGAGEVEITPDADAWWGGGWRGRPARWRVGVTGEVPLKLKVQTGASRADLDLSELWLEHVQLRIGASETVVRLPPPRGSVALEVDVGAASAELALPGGTQARINSAMGLGTVRVDESVFRRDGRTRTSPGYDTASDRYEISVRGGVGSVTIR